MSSPFYPFYYIPNYNYQNNNPFLRNNNIFYQNKNVPKEEVIELKDSDEEKEKEKEKEKDKLNNEINFNDLDEEEEGDSSLNSSINIFNSTDNNNNSSNIYKPIQKDEIKSNNILQKTQNNYKDNNNAINNLYKPKNSLLYYNYNNNNSIIKKISIKKNHIIDTKDYNKRNNEIQLSFNESVERLKKNFNKLFTKNIESENDNVFENEEFRNNLNLINNKNMKLIFNFHDVIKELYENKIETKIIEKPCELNKIIDNYINKMRKLGIKRNIVIKDYKNYLYIIGVEMMINKKDKQAKEFIVKKITETYKGNCKVNTKDDDCYFIEINNQNKTKQIYKTISNVTISLTMLLQNMYRDAVSK